MTDTSHRYCASYDEWNGKRSEKDFRENALKNSSIELKSHRPANDKVVTKLYQCFTLMFLSHLKIPTTGAIQAGDDQFQLLHKFQYLSSINIYLSLARATTDLTANNVWNY